jgi:curved DNA-binding protein CbpA
MPPKSAPPHYECLGVDPSISDADLSRHYKELSLQLHPDRAAYRNDSANEAHVQARYQRITEAYAVLSDPEKRNAYDTKHGVNFQSRLMRLQTMIGQHNTSAALRFFTATAATASNTATHAAPSATGVEAVNSVEDGVRGTSPKTAIPHACSSRSKGAFCECGDTGTVQSSEEEEDDDEYVPAAVGASRSTAHRGGFDERGDSDIDYSDEEGAWISSARSLFYLNPRTPVPGVSVEGVPITQYRGVTLSRTKPVRSGNVGTGDEELDNQWGLVLDGNVLVGLQDRELEDADNLLLVEGLGEVVFPATVQQVNDTMVHTNTDVAKLLRRPTQRASETSEEEGVVERLQLVLAFCTEEHDLVGDLRLLSDDAVLYSLVPEWCVVAEVPALLRDVRVLSVNSIPVRSAEELRRALREVVDAPSVSDGNAAAEGECVIKRPRTTRSVVLECCCLPMR